MRNTSLWRQQSRSRTGSLISLTRCCGRVTREKECALVDRGLALCIRCSCSCGVSALETATDDTPAVLAILGILATLAIHALLAMLAALA